MTECVTGSQRCLAVAVREACVQAALNGYENAAIGGLCHEGAWEAAISAIRMVDIEAIVNQCFSQKDPGRP